LNYDKVLITELIKVQTSGERSKLKKKGCPKSPDANKDYL